MFYTLASRIPLISTNKSKKFLLIFVVGSIAYILLHYYLYSGERFELLDKLKNYLYYVMALDLGVAYFLSKFSSSDDEKSNERASQEYSKEDREEIERNLYELRKMQSNHAELQRQKMLQMQYEQQQAQIKHEQADTKSNKEDKSQESPFMTREEVEESEKKEKKSNRSRSKKTKETTSSSSDSKPKKVPEKKPKTKKTDTKKSDLEEDTNFPVFGMN